MSLTLAVIPARAGSKGIPSKNIRKVSGVSLVERAVRTCLESDVDVVAVSTDCPHVKELMGGYDVIVVDRPAEFATDTASSESAVKHAIETVGWEGENTLLVQCTSPLTQPEDVNGVIGLLENYDCAFTVSPFHGFLWRECEAVNHDPSGRAMRQQVREFIENGAVYGFKTEGFMKYEHRFFGRKMTYVMPEERNLEIDEPFHLVLAETMINKNIHVNGPRAKSL